MKISLSNGVFSNRPLTKNLDAVRKLGFENLEFNMKSVKTEDDVAAYSARKLVDEHGLRVLTLHAATLPVENELEVHRAIYYGKISADFAAILSSPVLVVHSGVSRRLPRNLRCKLMERIFGELKPYAESLKLKLALENLSYASNSYGKDVAELEEIFSTIDSERTMGFTLDFSHAEATGQTFKLLGKYGKLLCNIHVSGRAHKPLTEETPNMSNFISDLGRLGYDGPLTIEVNSKSSTDDIRRTKAVLEKALNSG